MILNDSDLFFSWQFKIRYYLWEILYIRCVLMMPIKKYILWNHNSMMNIYSKINLSSSPFIHSIQYFNFNDWLIIPNIKLCYENISIVLYEQPRFACNLFTIFCCIDEEGSMHKVLEYLDTHLYIHILIK